MKCHNIYNKKHFYMKNKILPLICLICLSLSLSSCETAYAGISSSPQCDEQEILNNNVNYNIIIRYGTPYYYDGYLYYYLYEGLYYYPVYYNNYWYFRTYRRPFRYGYFPDNRYWRPRPYMRGVTTFGRPNHFGRPYRYNGYDRRPFGNYHQNRTPNIPRRVQNRSFGSMPSSRSNMNIQRQSRPSGSFGNGSHSGASGTRVFGGHR